MHSQEITFIQPRHSYAPETGVGQIYLPSSILSMKARILQAFDTKGAIKFLDENMEKIEYTALHGIVGISLLGAPYIPVVLDMIKKIPEHVTIILGGQIIGNFNDEEFQRIFCKERKNVFSGNDTKLLAQLLGVHPGAIPNVEDADLTRAYEDIPDEQMKEYVTREFCVYLSQGCKYNCSFCQAVKGTPEKYRDLSLLQKELTYLGNQAKKFGIEKLAFYLSNLDLLQTPNMFEKFLDVVEKAKDNCPGVTFSFRGLCGIESFLQLYHENKPMLERAKRLGLSALGFGVDGATAEVWKSIGKSHNFKSMGHEKLFANENDKAIETIRLTHDLGIKPEVLMVFGHPGENETSLEAAYDFCKDMDEIYGATPRPHVSKTIIPGTKAWMDVKNKEIVNKIIENPEYFQALDYTALPSELTHPDEKFLRLTRKWYKKICNLTPEATKYVRPVSESYKKIAERLGISIEKMNEGKFDR